MRAVGIPSSALTSVPNTCSSASGDADLQDGHKARGAGTPSPAPHVHTQNTHTFTRVCTRVHTQCNTPLTRHTYKHTAHICIYTHTVQCTRRTQMTRTHVHAHTAKPMQQQACNDRKASSGKPRSLAVGSAGAAMVEATEIHTASEVQANSSRHEQPLNTGLLVPWSGTSAVCPGIWASDPQKGQARASNPPVERVLRCSEKLAAARGRCLFLWLPNL